MAEWKSFAKIAGRKDSHFGQDAFAQVFWNIRSCLEAWNVDTFAKDLKFMACKYQS